MPSGEHLKGKGGVKFGSGQPTNLGGRKPKLKFAEYLEEALEGDGILKFRPDQFKIDVDGNCVVKMPTNQLLAYKMSTKAVNDRHYMDMLLKVTGQYAPAKKDIKLEGSIASLIESGDIKLIDETNGTKKTFEPAE